MHSSIKAISNSRLENQPHRRRTLSTNKPPAAQKSRPACSRWDDARRRRVWKGKCGSKNAQVGGLARRKRQRRIKRNLAARWIHSDFVQTQRGGGVRCNAHPYAPAGPSIHPTIYILARGPFALCQAILIPIYHLFLRRSFFSISPFFLGASFFFKPFDSNWFLSRPLIRTPFVLSLSIFLSSSRFFPCVFAVLSPFLFLSLYLCHTQVRVRICSLVLSRPVQRTFLFLVTSGKGIRERKAHDDVWKGSCRNIGRNQTFARFIAHEENRSRSDSVENRSLESSIIIILLFTTITSQKK